MDLRVPNATKSDSGIGSLCMLCHAGVASDPGANTRPIPPVRRSIAVDPQWPDRGDPKLVSPPKA